MYPSRFSMFQKYDLDDVVLKVISSLHTDGSIMGKKANCLKT